MLRNFQGAFMAAIALAAATSVAIAGLSRDRREDQPSQSRPKPQPTRQSHPPVRSSLPAVGGFDGGWSFTGTSTNCQGSGGGFFTVSGTQVVVSGGGRGHVSRNGAFQASTNAGGGVRLSAVGRLSGNRGADHISAATDVPAGGPLSGGEARLSGSGILLRTPARWETFSEGFR